MTFQIPVFSSGILSLTPILMFLLFFFWIVCEHVFKANRAKALFYHSEEWFREGFSEMNTSWKEYVLDLGVTVGIGKCS